MRSRGLRVLPRAEQRLVLPLLLLVVAHRACHRRPHLRNYFTNRCQSVITCNRTRGPSLGNLVHASLAFTWYVVHNGAVAKFHQRNVRPRLDDRFQGATMILCEVRRQPIVHLAIGLSRITLDAVGRLHHRAEWSREGQAHADVLRRVHVYQLPTGTLCFLVYRRLCLPPLP